MGRSRYKITQASQPHFITLTVVNWLPVFTRPETVNIIFNSLNYLSNEGLRIYAYVVLENHMHFILQSKQLDKSIARFKSFTARKLIDYLVENRAYTLIEQLAYYKKAHKKDRAYQFWQEGVHPELKSGEDMMRQKIEYIHYNPVKRGYVEKPEHWRYSSAQNYAGQAGLIQVDTHWN